MTDLSDQKYETTISHDPQMAIFKISNESYGIGISKVKEIVRYPEITAIPNAPLYLKGLANLRGNIFPVIDARIRLGLMPEEATENTRVIILNSYNLTYGIIVDKVNGVNDITNADIDAPPSILTSGVDSKFVTNVIKQKTDNSMIMELDVNILCAIKIEEMKKSGKLASEIKNAAAEKISVKEVQLVSCNISGEEYGFHIEVVREILRVGNITHVPEAPSYVIGIFSVRNSLLPVVDIRKLFGLASMIEEMTRRAEEFRNNTTVWFMDYEISVKSGVSIMADVDMLKINFIKWAEKFRTSSELISKSIQDIKVLYNRIEIDALRYFDFQKKNSAENSMKFFEQEFMQYSKLLLSKFQELVLNFEKEISEDQRIMVIEIGGIQTGVLVDSMRQVIMVPENIIDQPPSILSSQKSECLEGIVKIDGGKKLILLVDEKKLIPMDTMMELNNMKSTTQTKDDLKAASTNRTEEIQLVTFKLGCEEYGLNLENVQEINRLENITAVPMAPPFVEGLMNLRGVVIPAIDLRKKFNIEILAHNESTRVIIVNISGNLTGLIVDSVSEVIRLSKNLIDLPPDVISSNINTDFIVGIGKLNDNKRIIILINAEKILSKEEKVMLQKGFGSIRSKDNQVNDRLESEAETKTIKDEIITTKSE